MAVPTDSAIQEYIDLLVHTDYIEAGIERSQAQNMIDLLTFMNKTLADRKNQVQIMLAFYTTRLTRVEYLLEQIAASVSDEDLDLKYEEFQNYSKEYAQISTYMDSIAGMINYTVADHLGRLNKYRREEKLVSGAIIRFQILLDTYEILKQDLNNLITTISAYEIQNEIDEINQQNQ